MAPIIKVFQCDKTEENGSIHFTVSADSFESMIEQSVANVRSQIEIVSYGQNAEDVVLHRTFKHLRGGFYVDIGAGHPKFGSLTKNLYDMLGWTGIEIEPLPGLVQMLRDDRVRNKVVQAAIGTETGEQTFYELDDNWGMSTLDERIAQAHIRNGWNVSKGTVQVLTLESILAESAPPKFELLKIDVEGRERDVLMSFDINAWKPQVIVIESTLPDSTVTTEGEWEDILDDVGYTMCLFDGLNRFYCSDEALELAPALSVPANVFDKFIFSRWWDNLNRTTRDELDPDHIFRS